MEEETKEERLKRQQKARYERWKQNHPDGNKLASRKWRKNNPGRLYPKAIETMQIVDKLKTEPCMDCGRTYPTVCMDYDHRDRTDKYNNVGTMVAHHYNIEKILEEIAKCDLVCSNCHRIRTWGESRARISEIQLDTEVE